jgi:hypothetical protein
MARRECYQMARKALDLAIGWPEHTERTLSDLVERLRGIPPEDQEAVWSAIETWAAQGPDEARKAALRETIRRSFIIGSISATLVFLLYQKGRDSRIFQAP